MKRSIALSLLLLLTTLAHARAATYYVAPHGKDTYAGTFSRPFATIQKANDIARPGDTILLRGGTYFMTPAQITRQRGIYVDVTVLDTSGTAAAPITYMAYPGEDPIFDYRSILSSSRVCAFYVGGSFLHLKGFEVTGVQVTILTHTQSECFEAHGSNDTYDQLKMHDGQAIGFYLLNGSNNLILNCDAYRNWDYTSEGGVGGNTDGFGCHGPQGSVNNVFRGDRSWFNSDDGYDCIHCGEPVLFDHCWAYANGYNSDFKSLGDGNGFKAGGWAGIDPANLPVPIPRNIVRNCMAFRNKAAGFYANHQPGGSDWYNNTAYANSVNFNMLCRLADNVTDVPGYGHILENNLGFNGRHEVENLDFFASTVIANSFNGIPVTAADFQSLDESQFFRPRKADGSLPDITLLHLAPGSKLIGHGVPLDPNSGSRAPNIGAF